MHSSKIVETWVGLFVALGMVSLFFLAMKVSNLGELQTHENSFRVTARFQNAGSLKERSPVSMAGVRIGRVSSIRFDKETYEAVVEMRIDPQYDTIPQDSSANILTAGLLGEQYVGLTPGGAPETLKDGDEIELTQSALVLEEVISRFLFNKAEGSDKKGSAARSADEAEDTAIPATLKPQADGADEAKPETSTEAAKSKPRHGKSEDAAAPKAKPQGKAEDTDGAAKPKAAAH
ncbi:MAG: outer membrane lipid asymmetry maintenance protein MlaD [Candidatus Methylumidiphilus sp.]